MRVNKTAWFLKGFSLIELIVALALLVVIFSLTTPYLLGTKEKTLLQKEADGIADQLKIAQQQSIAAYEGLSYGIKIADTSSFILQPGGKTISLPEEISIAFVPSPDEITFAKLTGRPSSSLNLTLISKHFKCTVSVSSTGVITTSSPEKL